MTLDEQRQRWLARYEHLSEAAEDAETSAEILRVLSEMKRARRSAQRHSLVAEADEARAWLSDSRERAISMLSGELEALRETVGEIAGRLDVVWSELLNSGTVFGEGM